MNVPRLITQLEGRIGDVARISDVEIRKLARAAMTREGPSPLDRAAREYERRLKHQDDEKEDGEE